MALAFDHFAVHRETFPGLDHDQVIETQGADRHLLLSTIDHLDRPLRAQRFQGANGAGGLAFGAAFQVFTQQHQGNHHGRGFEVQVRHAPGGGGPFVEAQAIARAGAQGNKQVHVACPGTHGFPGGHIKARAEDELHGRCQGELRPGREHPVHAERLQQHRQYQRQGEGNGCDQRPALALQAGLLSIDVRLIVLPDAGGITRLAHGRDQGLRVDLPEQFQMGAFIGQVDADALDPRHFAQRPLDPADAGGAGHAVDAQFQALPRYAVTGFFHCVHQGRQAVGRRLDPGLLGGQVDADGTGADDFAQGALDTPGAAGAGHAGNRQIESGGFGHRSRSL
ncbi:hypothetical protein D3C76_745340 [compost metagenome]